MWFYYQTVNSRVKIAALGCVRVPLEIIEGNSTAIFCHDRVINGTIISESIRSADGLNRWVKYGACTRVCIRVGIFHRGGLNRFRWKKKKRSRRSFERIRCFFLFFSFFVGKLSQIFARVVRTRWISKRRAVRGSKGKKNLWEQWNNGAVDSRQSRERGWKNEEGNETTKLTGSVRQ